MHTNTLWHGGNGSVQQDHVIRPLLRITFLQRIFMHDDGIADIKVMQEFIGFFRHTLVFFNTDDGAGQLPQQRR